MSALRRARTSFVIAHCSRPSPRAAIAGISGAGEAPKAAASGTNGGMARFPLRSRSSRDPVIPGPGIRTAPGSGTGLSTKSSGTALGHWLLGYIHPYPDGNGRVARFLMNTMLASGGYPWTVIRVEDRDDYLAALEHASVDTDIVPFATFIAERVERSM